jgi:queuine tRNA-ribosyltransferase
MVEEVAPVLPAARPRYLMGVGSPEDLLDGITRGMDLFDSALPTRVARHGALFTREGRVNVTAARFRDQDVPIDATCDCTACARVSVAYLHHLFRSRELLAYRLAATHNLRFVLRLLEQAREAIKEGRFASFHAGFSAGYRPTDEAVRWEQRAAYGRAGSRPRAATKREKRHEAASPAIG